MKIGRRLGAFGLFLLLGIAAYSTILNSFFLSDDFAQIGRILEGDFSVTWGREHGGFFRPLFIFSYLVDSRLWGTAAVGYHLTNVLLHALNSYLVFILTRRWTRNTILEPITSLRVSACAGLIFLLLPSHTEAVSWISGRADLLSTLFALSALVSFDSYQQRGRIRHLAYTLALFMLALMAKESAICLPLIVVACEAVYRNGLHGDQNLSTFKADKRVQVVAYLDQMPAPEAEFEVVRNSTSIEIRILTEKMEFSQINGRLECVEILEQSRRLIRIKLTDCAAKDLFIFQQGRMSPLF